MPYGFFSCSLAIQTIVDDPARSFSTEYVEPTSPLTKASQCHAVEPEMED
jgi:hypothetical protein